MSFAVSVGQNGLELTCPTSASENAPRCTSSTSSSSPGRQALIKAFQVKTFSRTSRVAMLANNLKIQGKLDHDTEKKIVPTGTDCPGCDQYFSSSCSCMFDRVCASFSWTWGAARGNPSCCPVLNHGSRMSQAQNTCRVFKNHEINIQYYTVRNI